MAHDARVEGPNLEPGRPQRRWSVPQDWVGQRLDKALADQCPGESRTRLQEWIRAGVVRVDGEVVLRPSTLLEAGQRLEWAPWRPEADSRADQGPRFEVLHDEPDFAIIDKPPGMVAHPNDGVRAGTVADQARELWGPLPEVQGPDRPGVVHRLDGATSGVMVIVKSEPAAADLLRQFRERQVEKTYLAIVQGEPRFDSDWIEQPLGRSERSPDRISVMPEGEGRSAQTFYEVLERFGDHALVQCRPRTGRTHQLRVHLEWLGHGIAGDKLYTGRRARPALPADAPVPRRQALHALRISFAHPSTRERVEFEAPLAPDLQAFLDWLRGRAAQEE
jgi:23S rRNA pseudouridine1911/1915/1917 synthase